MDLIADSTFPLHFIRPDWLWLFLPVGVLLFLLRRSGSDKQTWTKTIAPHLRTYMITGDSEASGSKKGLWLVVALCLGVLALSGPAWEKIDIPGRGSDDGIVIAIDLSASMNATDIQPSRLERAKLKIRDFVEAHATARIGLIAFAGSAHTVVQPTRNGAAILLNLERLRTSIMPVPGSDIGQALLLADSLLGGGGSGSESNGGSIVLVTDSPDEESLVVSNMVSDSTSHQQVFWLFSTEQGAPIPEGKAGRFVRNASGSTVMTSLDTELAEAYAAIKNSHVISSTIDDRDVRKLNGELSRRSRALQSTPDQSEEWNDRGEWLLIPLAIIVLFWFRRGWVLQWSWLFIISLPLVGCSPDGPLADSFWTADQLGQQFVNRGDSLSGARVFEDPLRAGYAFLGAGERDAAVERFTASFTPEGFFNAGMVHVEKAQAFREPEWREKVAVFRNAVISFDESIRLDSLANAEIGTGRDSLQYGRLAVENRQIVVAEIDRLLARFTGGDPTELTKEGSQADGTAEKPDTEDGLSEEESDEGGATPPENSGAPQPEGEAGEMDGNSVYSDDELRASVFRSMNPDPSIYLQRKFRLQIQKSGRSTSRRLDPW